MSTPDKELMNLFSDPKNARKAWKAIGEAIASRPAVVPSLAYDRDGNPTLNSLIETYSYEKLQKDILALGSRTNNKPTELEMIMQCQFIKARTDTSAAVFIRDTLGAKPIDESKVEASVTNPYEQMTDEELELLANFRKEKQLAAATPAAIASEYLAATAGEQGPGPSAAAALHTLATPDESPVESEVTC